MIYKMFKILLFLLIFVIISLSFSIYKSKRITGYVGSMIYNINKSLQKNNIQKILEQKSIVSLPIIEEGTKIGSINFLITKKLKNF